MLPTIRFIENVILCMRETMSSYLYVVLTSVNFIISGLIKPHGQSAYAKVSSGPLWCNSNH